MVNQFRMKFTIIKIIKMKHTKNLLLILLVITSLYACKKDTQSVSTDASLSIVNASASNTSIVAIFSNQIAAFYTYQTSINYKSLLESGMPAGNVPLTLVSSADTTKPFFKGQLNLNAGGVYSLFIADKGSSTDTLLTKDHIVAYADSTAGVRFINLCADSGPINVNVQGSAIADFSNLNYKQWTSFKTYKVLSTANSYTFEIRNQSGDLLTTFIWRYAIHKNNTIVMSGTIAAGSSAPFSIWQVNNY